MTGPRLLLAYKSTRGGRRDPYAALLPIGLGYLHAVLRRHGYRSRLANFSGFSWQEVESALLTERPDVLAVSIFTHNRSASIRVADLAKKINPDCFIVVGGPHATPCYRDILAEHPSVDAVVLGEGEETLLDLVNHLTAGGRSNLSGVAGIACRDGAAVIATAPRLPVADLDSLPVPAEVIAESIGVDLHRQLEFIITSRGCPSSCTFCSSPRFWGKTLRFRSPRAVVDEIRLITERFGLIYYSIRDDTFTADRERTLEFCRLLVGEKVRILWNCQSRVSAVDEEMLLWMKRAGCECIQFGIESGSPEILRRLGKRITIDEMRHAALATRRAGIQLSVYLIAGVPGEREEDLEATCRLIDEIRPADGQVSPLAYYPGTPLFTDSVRTGAVSETIFRGGNREAFFVMPETAGAQTKKRLLARLTRAAERSRFTPGDFRVQKQFIGYCHATNILAGGMYEAQGDPLGAEREYREIIEREPDNPWGWLALGELYANWERKEEARLAFKEVTRLVPNHVPAYEALRELSG